MNIKRLQDKNILEEIQVGKYFLSVNNNKIYILSRCVFDDEEDIRLVLISVCNGDRFMGAIPVCISNNLTFNEIDKIFGKDTEWLLIGDYSDFLEYVRKG